jgi:hypothetical protein
VTVRGEPLTPERGDARLRARKEERATGAGDEHPRDRVAWIGAVSESLLPFHGCRSGTGYDRAPADARRSSQARASPITAAFLAEGNCGEPLGGPVPSAASPASGSSDCWTARSTGQLVRRPERASRAPLGVSSAAAPRSAQSASGMPTLIAEETKRADLTQLRGARPSLRVRRTHAPPARRPRSRRTRRARQASRRRVAAGAIGLFYARFTTCASRRLFGGAGGVGE